MGYFDFLSPDLETDDETDKTPASAEENAIKQPKTYSQRRGETSAEIFKTADQIIDKYAGDAPDSLREKYKAAVRANPDDAAKTIEKYYEDLFKVDKTQRLGQSYVPGPVRMRNAPYDPEFGNLENSVRAYRSMKRGPEEQALTGQLAQTDLQKNTNTLASLRQQLDTVTKELAAGDTLPEVVSGRGADERKKQMAAKQDAAAALSQHIKELEEQTKSQQAVASQAQGPSEEEEFAQVKNAPTALPQSAQPVTDYFDALGIDKKKLVQSMHDAFEAGGITLDKLDQMVPTHAGLLRTLSFLDRNGTFANALAQELAQAKAQDQQDRENGQAQQPQQGQPGAKGQKGQPQQQKPDPYAQEQARLGGEIQTLEQRSGEREARMRELYSKLNEAPFMQTWPGIILYVLTGMLVGPGIATKIFGNLDNRRAIGNELNALKFEMRRLDGQIESRQKELNYTRRMAIQRMTHQDDKAEEYDRDLQKMYLNNRLILERQKQLHPEQKGAYDQLGKAFVRERGFMRDAQHRKDEAQRILSNDFSDEKDKLKARADMAAAEQEVQQHKANLQALDGTIKKMGGIQMEQEEESGQ